MMTQKGIYISPDNTKPNRDRVDNKEYSSYTKEELLKRIETSIKDIDEIITIVDSIDIVRKLVRLSETMEIIKNLLNNDTKGIETTD